GPLLQNPARQAPFAEFSSRDATADWPWGPIGRKPSFPKLNAAGTVASDTVHQGEIVVIRSVLAASPGRLPKAGAADISPQTPVVSQGTVMAIQRTFSIIKPDATERNLTGAVNALIEKAGLRIVAQKRIRMTREQAETFYAVHKARPFF